jgi:hypothetical protein
MNVPKSHCTSGNFNLTCMYRNIQLLYSYSMFFFWPHNWYLLGVANTKSDSSLTSLNYGGKHNNTMASLGENSSSTMDEIIHVFSDRYNMVNIPYMYVSYVRTIHLWGQSRWMTMTNRSSGFFELLKNFNQQELLRRWQENRVMPHRILSLKMISAPVWKLGSIFFSHINLKY